MVNILKEIYNTLDCQTRLLREEEDMRDYHLQEFSFFGLNPQALPFILPLITPLRSMSLRRVLMYSVFAPNSSATSEAGTVASSRHFQIASNILSSVYFVSNFMIHQLSITESSLKYFMWNSIHRKVYI